MRKQILFSIIACLCLPLLLTAHSRNAAFKRTITKTFTVSDNARLSVSNKYGKIVLHTWDKNEIRATIVITGFGKDQDEAQKIANSVDIDASQSGNAVTLKTVYTSGSGSSFWGKLFNFSNKSGKDYANIDYDVYLPRSLATLDIDNNYGDVVSDDIYANTSISMNYCNYHLGNFMNNLKLSMNYSKGSVAKAGQAVVSANYSSLRSDELQSLKISCNYTDFQLAKVGVLSLSVTYGNVMVDAVNDISGNSNYTDYKIGKINGSADLKVTYGDVKIGDIGNGFKQIKLDGTYSGFKLGLPANAAFRIDARLVYGDLKTGSANLKNINSVGKSNTKTFSGISANGNESSPLISFNGTYSGLTLMPAK